MAAKPVSSQKSDLTAAEEKLFNTKLITQDEVYAAEDKAAAEADKALMGAARTEADAKAEADATLAAQRQRELDAQARANAASLSVIQAQIAALGASQTSASTLAAQKLATQTTDTMTVLADRFAKYGLTSLVGKIKELAISGATESTITLQLAETPEYQARFKANTQRLKKNLTVLSPGDYLAAEDSYRQVLRAYGLNQFDNDEYVSQFIANDVSPTELSNRVVTAVQRVQNADPTVAKTLRDYYGVGSGDMVAYVLDPEQQFQKIQRQVAAAEIGTAARVQGLEAGVNVSEQLAAQGITQAQAQKGYATIADILPTASKLSEIYGGDAYTQATAEQEVFNSLASAQRARQKLTSQEVASFSGASGMAKNALSQQNKTSGAF